MPAIYSFYFPVVNLLFTLFVRTFYQIFVILVSAGYFQSNKDVS